MADHREPNPGCDSWSFERTVILRDWWLIKCSKEFQGKRFGVAGIAVSVESKAMRMFTSSPIIKAFDVFTLQASDGICIILRGFLNKERIVESGFIPQISRDFILGFPPCWEQICNNCFKGQVLPATDINTVPPIMEQASCPILSPCEKNTKVNQEDSPAESSDKCTVTEKHSAAEINDRGSLAKDKKPARLRAVMSRTLLLSGKTPEDERKKLELSKVQNTTSDGDHGGEGLDKAKNGDVEKDECETIDNERKLDESKVQNPTNDGDHGGEGLDKAEVTRASPLSPSKDLNNSRKPRKKGKSKKSGKTLKSDGNVVEPMNHSGSKVEEAGENLSGEITNRKIDFDFEATPDKVARKQKTSVVSTDSLGQKRSRSGRVLVRTLEFWRNQVPVYDMNRNLIQVNKGDETRSIP